METETNRLAALALAGTITVAGVLGLSPSAHAAPAKDNDSAACVSWAEFRDAHRATMHDEEQAWEVTGRGKVVHAADHGSHIVKQYPRCGYTEAQGFAQVAYDRNKAGHYMASFITMWEFNAYDGYHRVV